MIFFAHLMEIYPLQKHQQLCTSSEFEALQKNLASPIEFGQFSTLHLAAASFRQDNFLSTKSMSFVGPSRAALIKSSKAKSDGDSFSWTVRHWCNIWNNIEQWLCFTCIWECIINPVFVVCLCICIFDCHIMYLWLWQAIPSNTFTWTWSVCLSNSVFVVLYVFVFVFVCLFICVCICDTVTARQWPLLQAPPMLTPCLTASSLLSNLSQIHVLPHIYTYIHL